MYFFYPRVPLQGMAAGYLSASSCTITRTGSKTRNTTTSQQNQFQISSKWRNPSRPNESTYHSSPRKYSASFDRNYSSVTRATPRVTPPAGRLKHCNDNWTVITSDSWVLQSVQGYHLEMMRQPVQRGPLADLHLSEIAQEYINT